MAILPILEFPDPRLRTIAKPVEQIDTKVKQLVHDMFETMYDAPGIGLAATQVNNHIQVVVMDLSVDKNEPMVFINPKLTITCAEKVAYNEGCLSVPTFQEEVLRSKEVTIEALDLNGAAFVMQATDLLAVCIQHECDHLNGKLFVDYLSNLKRNRIKQKLLKSKKYPILSRLN